MLLCWSRVIRGDKKVVQEAHGDMLITWIGNICLTQLNGPFNEEGSHICLLNFQHAWQQHGKPKRWAHVLDLQQWLGRTPECTPFIKEAMAWALTHGLSCAVAVMGGGSARILWDINQRVNPAFPSKIVSLLLCDDHQAAAQLLIQQGFDGAAYAKHTADS